MASSGYASVAMTETGLACEGGFGQRYLSNLSNILASLRVDPDIANLRHGQPLTREDRNDAIRRLRQAHLRLSKQQLAAKAGVSQQIVSDVLAAKNEQTTGYDKIRRLHQAHPDWSQRRLAAKVGVSQKTVSNVLAAKIPQDAEPDDPTWTWPRWTLT